MDHELFVPGRIEVLGKHTDYAGGRSLLCATQQGIRFQFSPRNDNLLHIRAADGEEATFAIDTGLKSHQGHWSNYAITVARRVARNFPGKIIGADVRIGGDFPPASGLSSSSAVIIGY